MNLDFYILEESYYTNEKVGILFKRFCKNFTIISVIPSYIADSETSTETWLGL